jgi:hypothetical protein
MNKRLAAIFRGNNRRLCAILSAATALIQILSVMADSGHAQLHELRKGDALMSEQTISTVAEKPDWISGGHLPGDGEPAATPRREQIARWQDDPPGNPLEQGLAPEQVG